MKPRSGPGRKMLIHPLDALDVGLLIRDDREEAAYSPFLLDSGENYFKMD